MALRKQLLVSTGANLGTIASGMTLGFSAVALPAIQSLQHVPNVSDDEASWIASLTAFGAPAGALLIGPLLDRLGRKRTMMLVNVPAFLGWILVATAYEPWFLYQLYTGRFLTGIAAGLASAPAVVYVSEVVDRTLRGVVVTWPSIGVSLGTLLVYFLGAVYQENWRMVAAISAMVPLIAFISVWFMVPESPVWLAAKGRAQEAEANMRKVRKVGRDENLPECLREELEAMTSKSDDSNGNKSDTWMDTLRFLRRPEAYKPLIIMNCFFLFQQFSGIFVVIFYAVNIVRETGVQFDGYIATVLIGVTRLVMSIVTSYASRSMGRRVLCNVSGVGMTLSMTALSGYICLVRDGFIPLEDYSWIPVVALIVYIITSTVGFLNLPFAMLGEVFPTRIRGSACGFTTCMYAIFCFIAVKLFPDMRATWGYNNLFMAYATVALVGTVVMHKYLPETQGKTLQEVEDSFKDSSKRKFIPVPINEVVVEK